jgi:hypothetical protein
MKTPGFLTIFAPRETKGELSSLRVPMRFISILTSLAALTSIAKPTQDCGLQNTDLVKLLKPGQIVFLGEVHGTKEVPSLLASVACEASKKTPLLVGLELSDDAHLIEAFLASDGSDNAKRALLKADAWILTDGRTSMAMFETLDRFRAMKRQGQRLDVFFYDSLSKNRLQEMGSRVIEVSRAHPESALLILGGNQHPRKKLFYNKKWAGNYIVEAGIPLISLNMTGPAGTSWMMRANGVSEEWHFGGPPGPFQRGRVTLGRNTEDGAYDGTYEYGETTSTSRPALLMYLQTAKGLDATLLDRKFMMESDRAYAKNDYAACADRLSQVKSPLPSVRYNLASCLARLGNKDEAFEQLTRLLTLGIEQGLPVDQTQLLHDEDLTSLRNDARWPALMGLVPAKAN